MRGGWKDFYMQPFDYLYIKCGQIILKNGLVPFRNKYLVGSSQKIPIFGTWKMKNGFSVQRKGKLPSATLFAIPIYTLVQNMGSFEQTMPRMYP